MMSKVRWAIPFLMVAVSGCASAPTPTEQSVAVKEPEKPAQNQTAEKAKPKATKTAKQKTPLVVAAPTEAVDLPPSVFEDAAALVPAQQQGIGSPTDSAQPEWSSALNEPATSAPTYTLASLTDPALIETPDSSSVQNILPQAALPQSLAPSPDAAQRPMKFLSELERTGEAPDGSYGYILIDAQTGQTLSGNNADTLLAPASIAKLLAAVAIMDTKGLHSTFRTSLLADGPVSDGVLKGDLHLVGSGDPSLNRADLAGLGRRLAASGIRSFITVMLCQKSP